MKTKKKPNPFYAGSQHRDEYSYMVQRGLFLKWVRRLIIVSGLFFLSAYALNVPLYVVWLLKAKPSLFPVLKELGDKYVPMMLFVLYLARFRGPPRLWLLARYLALCVGIVAVAVLAVNGNQLSVQGYRWQWVAVAVWSLTAYLLLGALARAPALKAVILAYAGVLFASVLYEIPWILLHGDMVIFLTPKWVLSGLLMVLGIYDYGTPDYRLLLAAMLTLGLTAVAWLVGVTPWFIRLPSALLVLSFFAGWVRLREIAYPGFRRYQIWDQV